MGEILHCARLIHRFSRIRRAFTTQGHGALAGFVEGKINTDSV